MASEPRTIKGPCFDECERGIHWNRTQGTHKWCGCQTRGKTEPHEKIEHPLYCDDPNVARWAIEQEADIRTHPTCLAIAEDWQCWEP